jgi:excisionase family DNA binding protein
MNDYLTYRETAEYLGVAVGTIYSMVARGQIPHVRLGPRLVRFPRAELDAWLAARTVRPAGDAQNGSPS